MKIYKRKSVHIVIAAILLAGMLTGSAAAFSVGDAVKRVGEFTAWINGIVERLRGMARQTASEIAAEAPKEDVFSRDLSPGMKNEEDVRKLQQFLIDNGYLQGAPTGNFSLLTKSAMRRFQAATGLPDTGNFDRQTRDAVNGLLNGQRIAVVPQKRASGEAKTVLVKNTPVTALVRNAATSAEIPVNTPVKAGAYRIEARPAYDFGSIEQATFAAVNSERQKNGLSALQWNERLADVARAHSSDQATDNTKTTDPDVACLYPYIRHEGFTFGFKVGDRLDGKSIPYAIAGENIIILPMTKDLIYRTTDAAPTCDRLTDLEGPMGETQDAARVRVQKSILDRLSRMTGLQKLDWVNKRWKGAEEIASESAEGWMNSPGHRHNILTPNFEEGAIGAAIVNDYIIMTQVFRKP